MKLKKELYNVFLIYISTVLHRPKVQVRLESKKMYKRVIGKHIMFSVFEWNAIALKY